MLGYVQVKDELNLTGDQMEKIKAIGDDFIEKHVRTFEASAQNADPEGRRKYDQLKRREQEAIEKAKAALTPEQAARFRQMEIWVKGPVAFAEADVARDLNLTAEQKAVLKTIGAECLNEVGALGKSLRSAVPGRITTDEKAKRAEKIAEMETQRQAVCAAKETECLAVLTDDQKARFLKLRGAKFELRRGPPRVP
jgi:hypothetical protein